MKYDGEMLARLVAQAEAAPGQMDMLMIRALIEEASELGAGRALERLGLSDDADETIRLVTTAGQAEAFEEPPEVMGRRLAHELIPYATDNNRKALDGLSGAEIETLMALLLRVQQNLRTLGD